MFWEAKDIPLLQRCIKSILKISDTEFENILMKGTPDTLRKIIARRANKLDYNVIDEICNVLTKVVAEK